MTATPDTVPPPNFNGTGKYVEKSATKAAAVDVDIQGLLKAAKKTETQSLSQEIEQVDVNEEDNLEYLIEK
jgi:hypothetical protein